MTVKDLNALTAGLSDDTEIYYKDPNFPGEYEDRPVKENFLIQKVDNGEIGLLIEFPFENCL